MATKPRVLVLGGLGFIGKHLVDYIVKNDLASKVRVVDKTMLEMARLSKAEEELFSKVECIQANLSNHGKSISNVDRLTVYQTPQQKPSLILLETTIL